jgi:hypothetical protein
MEAPASYQPHARGFEELTVFAVLQSYSNKGSLGANNNLQKLVRASAQVSCHESKNELVATKCRDESGPRKHKTTGI